MSVNLILKTTDISLSNTTTDYYGQTVSTEIGTVSNYRLSFNWKNVNMQILLGELFYKYEKFQIALISVSGSSTGITGEPIEDNRNLQVKLSGLPFISSYNQATGINNNIVTCSHILIPYLFSTAWESKNNIAQYFTFTKQNMCNISIDLHSILTDKSPYISSKDKMIGHCLFSFTITGIDDLPNERIDIKTYGYNKNF